MKGDPSFHIWRFSGLCVPDRVCNPGTVLHNSSWAWQHFRSVSSSASVRTHGLFLHTPPALPSPQSRLRSCPALPRAPPGGRGKDGPSATGPRSPRLVSLSSLTRFLFHPQAAAAFKHPQDPLPGPGHRGHRVAGWGPQESCGHTVSASQGRVATAEPRAGTAAGKPTGHAGIRTAPVCPPQTPAPRPTLGQAQGVTRRAGQPRPGRARAVPTAPSCLIRGLDLGLPCLPSWGSGG